MRMDSMFRVASIRMASLEILVRNCNSKPLHTPSCHGKQLAVDQAGRMPPPQGCEGLVMRDLRV